MQKIIVFLGPSLEIREAEKILSARYLPPAKRGDLLAAVNNGATFIGLIDGVFHQESAVAHREILSAVRKGVRVVGASSMGALRAAEMDTLGMVGIGKIYRMYKSGELESDDEVALVFDPSSGLALSEPLINIRFTLKRAEQEGIIDRAVYEALLASARSLFYPNRTYRTIVAQAGDSVDDRTRGRFLEWVETGRCDQKREDAIAALEYIHEIAFEEKMGCGTR
jgi:TfuA protein